MGPFETHHHRAPSLVPSLAGYEGPIIPEIASQGNFATEPFHTYIERNGGFIPNYGERYRQGERISTGFVESTVNQVISKRFCKKQQMAWTQRGAHLLLQIRTRVLNGDWEATFREWYPGFRVSTQQAA
jgi:hypothetical protein